MTVPDYVRLYRGRQAELGAVATTWGLAFDRLRRRSPLAAGVLETMSFLAADTIAVEMLWPLADGDELDVQEAIGELLRLSLVDRKGPILRVHRLVQDVVRVGLGPATAGTRLDAAARICLAVDADERDAAAHLVQVAAHCEALRRLPLGLLDGLAAVARRFAERALYPAAEQVLTSALRLAGVQSAGRARPSSAARCCASSARCSTPRAGWTRRWTCTATRSSCSTANPRPTSSCWPTPTTASATSSTAPTTPRAPSRRTSGR